MTTSNARYIISAAVRSSSDEDGTTLLHVAENKIYGLVGLGSAIWQKLVESKSGLGESDIVTELGSEFSEMSTQQIERDVTKLLHSFEQKHLVDRASNLQDLKTGATDRPRDSLFLFFNAAIRLLLCLRMHVLATVLAFVVVALVLKVSGFKQLYNLVRLWPTAERSVGPEVIPQMWGEIRRGITWYPRQVMCLQRSAVTTWLLRSRGAQAQMVIGCQRRPFLVHAWTEVNGEVVNDCQSVRELHKIIDRC
jgi:hypothetical protein